MNKKKQQTRQKMVKGKTTEICGPKKKTLKPNTHSVPENTYSV